MENPIKKENLVGIFNKFLQSKILLGFVIFVFAVKLSTSLVFVNFPSNIFFADITRSNLVSMLNQTRQSLGLGTLTENAKLDQAAELKAEDMVQNGYFNHTSPSGTTPWYWFTQSGYNYKYAGENLAIGYFESEEVYTAWLNSPSHKENIVNPHYTEVGTAVLEGFGSNNAIVVVQLFGSQKIVKATNTATTKPTVATTTEATTTTPAVETTTTPEAETTTENVASPDVAGTTQEKVLSSSIVLEADKNSAINNLYSRFLNFVLYSYDTVLQYSIYTVLLIIVIIFTYTLSSNFNYQINNGLVLRSLILITILFSSALINKDLILLVFPHQITI